MTPSAAMQAALRTPGNILVPVLTLYLPEEALPAGVTGALRIAKGPFASLTAGWFDRRVVTWGRSTHELSDRAGNLRGWSLTPEICDLPRTDDDDDITIGPFGRAVKSADCRGSVAVLQIAARNADGTPMDPADWWTERTGILEGWQRAADPTNWTLRIKADDEALRRPVPRGTITSPDPWPSAFRPPKDQEQVVVGQYIPVALGRVNSTGLGDHGLRRTLLVDTSRNRYLVSLGNVPASGFRVFVDGVEQLTGWTREVIRQGGKLWTVVTFASALSSEQVVTVDCQGLDLGSYGTYTNPAAQLRWILEHLVFNDWNGEGEIAPTRTEAASFAALAIAMGTREGAPGWLTMGQQVTGEELLRRFCTAHGAEVWWNELGEIAVDMLDPTALDLDATTNIILQGANTTRAPLGLLTPATEELWQAVKINHLLGADGKGMADLSIFHPRHLDAAPHPVAAQWLDGRVI